MLIIVRIFEHVFVHLTGFDFPYVSCPINISTQDNLTWGQCAISVMTVVEDSFISGVKVNVGGFFFNTVVFLKKYLSDYPIFASQYE